MARPQTVTDTAIVEAALEIMFEYGPGGLTFEKLGQRVGLVPAALVRRFSTKRDLVRAADRFALKRSQERLDKVLAEHDAPIEAILAEFIAEKSFASTLDRFIHGEEFLLMDLADKDLYTNYRMSFQERHQRVVEMLEKAKARGELEANLNAEEIAQFLQMILHGAGHVWAMDQKGSIDEYITRYVLLALEPYRLDVKEGENDEKRAEKII